MGLSKVFSRAQLGIRAPEVSVEVHTSAGLPKLAIVGLPAAAVRESKDRVRSAIINSRFEFPRGRITVNLAPADLPKDGGRYDLAIAIGVLGASGQLSTDAELERYELLSELALDGRLRRVVGLLPAALECARAGRKLITMGANATEGALAGPDTVLGAGHLLDVVAHLAGRAPLFAAQPESPEPPANDFGDLCDVRGQWHARRAVEIAAAGSHNLLMIGPPGTGKTMLARRLPTISPMLDEHEALDSAVVRSVSVQGFDAATFGQRPFRSPHHSASAVALVGGGNPPRPGEISLAHNGVLFLDELGEFPRHVLDALRAPIESGQVLISRAGCQASFPARIQLVACMNPCPCGMAGDPTGECVCTAQDIARYQGRVSGPMLDRFDLLIEVPRLRIEESSTEGESSHAVHARVLLSHRAQRKRQGCLNAALTPSMLKRHAALDSKAEVLLASAAERLCLSERARQRVQRVARTIADLAGSGHLEDSHLAEALSYRTRRTV